MPGLPVHHQLPEFTQTHVHWVGDAIQPPHPLFFPSPPALNQQGFRERLSGMHGGHLLGSGVTELSKPILPRNLQAYPVVLADSVGSKSVQAIAGTFLETWIMSTPSAGFSRW